jgi:hypothetical protein
MLHCAACGRHLIGQSGRYRHTFPCSDWLGAARPAPRVFRNSTDHRHKGVSYPASFLRRSRPQALKHVSANAELAGAAARVVRDRDYESLRATMEQLDREETAPRAIRQTEGVPADRAVRYLQGLGEAWRLADGGPGRAELARSLFTRIDASGFQAMRLHLTAEATAHGFAYAVPATFTGFVGYGRGERI